jgi:hypothetical protein
VKFKIQVVVESELGETQLIQEVLQIEKGNLQPETLGLILAYLPRNFSLSIADLIKKRNISLAQKHLQSSGVN